MRKGTESIMLSLACLPLDVCGSSSQLLQSYSFRASKKDYLYFP